MKSCTEILSVVKEDRVSTVAAVWPTAYNVWPYLGGGSDEAGVDPSRTRWLHGSSRGLELLVLCIFLSSCMMQCIKYGVDVLAGVARA